MLIKDANLVIVDVETTGIDPNHERIIELAAVKIRGDNVEDTFESFVDPERAIPRVIARLTGITSADVFGAPRAYEILPDFVDFLGNAVFVAHNCSFDWNFIETELLRAQLPKLKNSTLCTVRVARRLLTGLPSRSLGSLIKFFDIKPNHRHRALSDVLSTHQVLNHLIDRLEKQHEITELDQLLRFQNSRYEKKSIKKNLPKIEYILTQLPDASGVYKMFNKDGRILYIGKSKSLKDRVRSYFTGIESHARHTREMIRQVQDIQWTVTQTELEALLLESRLIKEFAPHFNKAGRTYRHRPCIRLGMIGNSSWVTVVEHIHSDGGKHFGPISSRKEASRLAQALVHLFGDKSDTFRSFERDGVGLTSSKIGGRLTDEGLQNAQALLEGRDTQSLATLLNEINEASKNQAYEIAAQKRIFLNSLESIQSRPDFLRTPLLERTGLVVYQRKPSTEIHFMVCGVPVVHLKWTGDHDLLKTATSKFYEDAVTSVDRVTAHHMDAISVMGAWMYKQKNHISVIPFSVNEQPQNFEGKLLAILENESIIKKK